MTTYITRLQDPNQTETAIYNTEVTIRDVKLLRPISQLTMPFDQLYALQLTRNAEVVAQTADFQLQHKAFALNYKWEKPIMFQKIDSQFKPKYISLRFVRRIESEYGTIYELVSSRELEIQPKTALSSKSLQVELNSSALNFDKIVANVQI